MTLLPIVSAPAAEGDCHAEWKRPEAPAVPVDLASVRARIQAKGGRDYWQSLEQVAGSPEFEEMLHREFPRFAAEWPAGVSRRNFLQLAAASLGLAGLTACTRQPIEKIVPYVDQPEGLVLGRPLFFATAAPSGGLVEPVLAESHQGRPTKLEGNPEHPASLGSTTALTQAAILGLYDPDRSQAVTHLGRISAWSEAQKAIGAAMARAAANEGAGLRLLTGPTSSPTEAKLVAELQASYPKLRWHRWDPLGADGAHGGALAAFGRPVSTVADLAKADVLFVVESDLLATGADSVRNARDFASRRRPTSARPEMNRLYVVESSPTPTGTMADHRLARRPSELPAVIGALAAALGVPGAAAPSGLDEKLSTLVRVAASDLAAHRGRALVVAGPTLPASVHAAVHAINAQLGAYGATAALHESFFVDPVDGLQSLVELANDLRAGAVELLLVSGVNPVYDAPADLDFASALNREGTLRVHHGLYADETAELCQWHVPATHFLEAFGDARAADGSVTLAQPLIEPLYGGKSWLELLAVAAGRGDSPGHDLLRERWAELSDDDFRKALHDGFVAGSTTAAVEPLVGDLAATWSALAAPATRGDFELSLAADPAVGDGRFANNGWLQELPKPITKLTWDNALLVSPRTAEQLGAANEQLVEVAVGAKKLLAPAWIVPGQADGVATLHLGYGRRRAGKIADGIGVDAYALQSSAGRWFATATLAAVEDSKPLACTQGHYSIANWLQDETEEAAKRHVVRDATLEAFKADPAFPQSVEHKIDKNASFAPGYAYTGYKWGMTIDLGTCTGCNACVVACQAENNIPVVGKEQVRRGREMHWIRIDRYYKGGLDEPEAIASQPIPCMQCEQAPCETVCPVAATTHSTEGLNDMVYNRCVGTRYCANNCPYKVRRFNFLLYQDWDTPQYKLQRNPDVSVRSRGVMEKCTYCVQRINRARIAAERDGRKVKDGEIVTACQQACPPRAIEFGDMNDAGSRLMAAKADPRNYGLLEELGTRPRTTYLAIVRNPHPELHAPAATHSEHAG